MLQTLLGSALVVFLCAWVHGSSAQATPRGPALNWVRLPGAETCIAPVELAERVEARLERRVFVRTPDAIIIVEGQVAPDASGGFVAALRVGNAAGEIYGSRELASPDSDCRKLDEVLALVISVTIRGRGAAGIALPADVSAELDALFAGEPTELDPTELSVSEQPPASTREPPATPSASKPPPDARHPEAEDPWGFGLGAGLGAATGTQPGGSIGPTVHLALSLQGIGSAWLSGWLGLPQRLTANDPNQPAQGTLTLTLLHAGLALCGPELTLGPSLLAPCVHTGFGRLDVQSEGFLTNGSAASSWLEVGPEAGARVVLGDPLSIRVALRMPVRLARPAFGYTRRDATPVQAFRVARVGVEAELGLSLQVF